MLTFGATRALHIKSGIGQDNISAIESGRHEARPLTLRRLAEALDVEVADLFREPEVPKVATPF
jgi:transcriptional regulator with XRE-family HTH domain